ncbi:hypothetical protein, partial [Klebsiella quasipneumoniae]
CAAPSAKGDDKFITTDYLQQCRIFYIFSVAQPAYPLITSGCISGEGLFFLNKGRECVRNPRQK